MIASFIQRAVVQGIPLLFGSTGEIITEKSGNLNLGIPGIMYVGGISGVIGAFMYERSLADPSAMNPFLAVIIPLLTCVLGSLCMGLIYSLLTVTLRANQNVTGLALTTFGTGFGICRCGGVLHIIRKEIFHLNRYVFPLILLRIGGYVKFGGTGNHIKNSEFSQGQKADDNNDRYNSSYRQGFS